ncbi:SecY subunit of pre protein translocase [Pilobolus umbonatus]|nr:SecY subunit of pre protein translocase [Pilobolus umbonatus]
MVRVLRLLKPFMAILPEISAPDRKVPLNMKILYTGVSLLLYMVMCQVPLYGIQSSTSSDPLYYMRVLLASNRGTLAELGVLPILTSGMVFQLLAGAHIIHVDSNSKEDRALFCGAQKLFAICLAFIQATVLVFTGIYGNPETMGTAHCLLLVAQLVASSTLIVLLDELIQKGYGLGSGMNLFMAAHITQTMFWKLLSFKMVETYRGKEYEGAILSMIHLILTRQYRGLKDAFYRPDLPNGMNVVATLIVFAMVVYLQGFRVELQVRSNRLRGQTIGYPIKLFYTATMPLMLQTALFANYYIFSQALSYFAGSHFLVRILGVWEPIPETTQLTAGGGIAYYLSAPHSLKEAIIYPVHTLVYLVISVALCTYISKLWMEISNSTARDVARTLKEQQLTISGYRDVSMVKELKRVIPAAAAFGGAILAMVSVTGDILNAIGSGAGILMSVMIVFQYFEMFVTEQREGNMSMDAMMNGLQ